MQHKTSSVFVLGWGGECTGMPTGMERYQQDTYMDSGRGRQRREGETETDTERRDTQEGGRDGGGNEKAKGVKH